MTTTEALIEAQLLSIPEYCELLHLIDFYWWGTYPLAEAVKDIKKKLYYKRITLLVARRYLKALLRGTKELGWKNGLFIGINAYWCWRNSTSSRSKQTKPKTELTW